MGDAVGKRVDRQLVADGISAFFLLISGTPFRGCPAPLRFQIRVLRPPKPHVSHPPGLLIRTLARETATMKFHDIPPRNSIFEVKWPIIALIKPKLSLNRGIVGSKIPCLCP